MLKDDIIDIVHGKIGFSRNEAVKVVELVFDTIKSKLTAGEDVNIVRFGRFRLRNKRERIGRNPKTGKEHTITTRRVLTFKASKKLKEIVNK